MILKNFLYRLIAVLLSFSLAFGLAELAVRVCCPQEVGPTRFAFDPELGDIPVPGQRGRRIFPKVYDFTYSNNSLGFRGSQEYGPKTSGSLRLLLLGDSFTYGFGVNDDQTFACLLEHYLRQHHLAAEVINTGNPGKGTDYELKLFQTVGVKLQPDLTVLCFFANDFQDNARGEYYAIQPDGGLRVKYLHNSQEGIKAFLFHFPGYSWLISWSQAANLVKQAAVNYLVARQQRRQQPGSATPAASGLVISYSYTGQGFSNDANRKLTEVYVTRLVRAVKQAGGDLAFCYIPEASEVEEYRRTRKASRDEEAIQAIIAAQGGRLFSLTPVLAASSESIRDLYYAEGHWSRQAHELAGNSLGNYLLNLLQERVKRRAAAN